MRDYLPSDLDEVNAWHVARGLARLTPAVLPRSGRIVEGVAAGWLYRTDSAVALLECFVTNPAAPLLRRYDAIGAIVADLTLEALTTGARHVVGFTESRGVARLTARVGLKPGGLYRMMHTEG